MGEVFRATDSRLGRDVAIKVLPAHLAGDADAVERLQREAKAIAALSHPNILAVHLLDQYDGGVYMVTELLEGETLRDRMRHGPLPWRRAVEIGASVADALAAAHAREVIHRDIKPENVFVTNDGVVKVLDFGLAVTSPLIREPADDGRTLVRSDFTEFAGTLGYMSPEQITGEPVTPASDIFALGCVLYEMLAGQRPFQRATTADTLAAIIHEDPTPLSPSGALFPPELVRLILRCLEKKRFDRFQSARDLAFALRATLTDSTPGRQALAAPKKKAQKSIAVLPFANLSSDSGAEYLSDGISETIINHLSQLPKIRVIARATAFRYKGSTADARTIGNELNVDMILSGRVLQIGDTLRVHAELVNVADDAQIWGEQFSRKIADVFAVQDEISSQISEKLKAKLSGEAKKRLKKRDPRSAEAYQLYLRGRYHWNKRTADGFHQGIEAFRQAIEIDPSYALAYCGLADCYNLLNTYNILAPHSAFPQARAAAQRALELDDTLAEAHASRAFVAFYYEWDWDAAEAGFKRALELNPNYATANHWYGWFLTMRGRFDEAAASFKRAREIDPLSLVIQVESAWPHFFARRYDLALGQIKCARDIDRDFIWVHFALGCIYAQQRNFVEAIQELELTCSRYDSPYVRAELGRAYALAGRTADARQVLDTLLADAQNRYISAVDLGRLYSSLGDDDAMFARFEQALEQRDPWLTRLDVDPHLDRVRDDPRFQRLRERIGLTAPRESSVRG
jgi:eukaryotic-like serine/threonine-protein kinase